MRNCEIFSILFLFFILILKSNLGYNKSIVYYIPDDSELVCSFNLFSIAKKIKQINIDNIFYNDIISFIKFIDKNISYFDNKQKYCYFYSKEIDNFFSYVFLFPVNDNKLISSYFTNFSVSIQFSNDIYYFTSNNILIFWNDDVLIYTFFENDDNILEIISDLTKFDSSLIDKNKFFLLNYCETNDFSLWLSSSSFYYLLDSIFDMSVFYENSREFISIENIFKLNFYSNYVFVDYSLIFPENVKNKFFIKNNFDSKLLNFVNPDNIFTIIKFNFDLNKNNEIIKSLIENYDYFIDLLDLKNNNIIFDLLDSIKLDFLGIISDFDIENNIYNYLIAFNIKNKNLLLKNLDNFEKINYIKKKIKNKLTYYVLNSFYLGFEGIVFIKDDKLFITSEKNFENIVKNVKFKNLDNNINSYFNDKLITFYLDFSKINTNNIDKYDIYIENISNLILTMDQKYNESIDFSLKINLNGYYSNFSFYLIELLNHYSQIFNRNITNDIDENDNDFKEGDESNQEEQKYFEENIDEKRI